MNLCRKIISLQYGLINQEQDSKRSTIRLHENINILIKVKKLKKGKEVGNRIGVKENISLSVGQILEVMS